MLIASVLIIAAIVNFLALREMYKLGHVEGKIKGYQIGHDEAKDYYLKALPPDLKDKT